MSDAIAGLMNGLADGTMQLPQAMAQGAQIKMAGKDYKARLASGGLMEDANGNVINDPNSPVTADRMAQREYQKILGEQAKAQTESVRANIPDATDKALERRGRVADVTAKESAARTSSALEKFAAPGAELDFATKKQQLQALMVESKDRPFVRMMQIAQTMSGISNENKRTALAARGADLADKTEARLSEESKARVSESQQNFRLRAAGMAQENIQTMLNFLGKDREMADNLLARSMASREEFQNAIVGQFVKSYSDRTGSVPPEAMMRKFRENAALAAPAAEDTMTNYATGMGLARNPEQARMLHAAGLGLLTDVNAEMRVLADPNASPETQQAAMKSLDKKNADFFNSIRDTLGTPVPAAQPTNTKGDMSSKAPQYDALTDPEIKDEATAAQYMLDNPSLTKYQKNELRSVYAATKGTGTLNALQKQNPGTYVKVKGVIGALPSSDEVRAYLGNVVPKHQREPQYIRNILDSEYGGNDITEAYNDALKEGRVSPTDVPWDKQTLLKIIAKDITSNRFVYGY